MKSVLIFGFLLFFVFSSTMSYAILWDFNNDAQEKDWKAIFGTCEIDKDKTYKISDPAGEALAIAGESFWTDYTITCKARLTQPAGFNNIAIAFRATEDGTSEYMLMFEGGRQQAEWWKKVSGAYTEIKVSPLEIDLKNWFTVKVVVKGKTFEGYYNDKFINSIEDSALKEGKVGARVYGCTSHIDDFDVNGPGIPLTSVDSFGKLTTAWGEIKK
jgi:hypothetical protein